jgi:hypothetical protein
LDSVSIKTRYGLADVNSLSQEVKILAIVENSVRVEINGEIETISFDRVLTLPNLPPAAINQLKAHFQQADCNDLDLV